jgi:hypothetical protein
MAGDESGKSAKGKALWNKALAKTSSYTEKQSPTKDGKTNLWNISQMASNQKKATQEPAAPEAHDINSLMTKNISDAFQMPINEAFNMLTKQATKVAPNSLLSKLAATADTETGRYDLSDQSELTPFRPTYTEANIKDIIKHDFFKVSLLYWSKIKSN